MARRRGDTRAGSTLVRRHFQALHRFFAGKADGQVEDLIQQTFFACVEAKEGFRGESSFRAYSFGLARLQPYTYYRKNRRLQRFDAVTSSVRDMGISPTGTLAEREDKRLLALALQQACTCFFICGANLSVALAKTAGRERESSSERLG